MDLDSLAEKLGAIGLKEFINEHQRELCERTLNPNKVASSLHFDFDMGAIINAPPDNFSKCHKMYELIQKKSKVKDFLEALKDTDNKHVIIFIQSKLADPSSARQIPSSLFYTKTGIWFNIPEPIDSFCGREDFISQLHEKLQNQHPVHSTEAAVAGPSRPKTTSTSMTSVTVLSQVKIVSGLGGIGKTETATQYIWSHRKSYNNFVWINAESESSMKNSFTKLASELKIPIKNEEGKSRDIEEIIKEIYSNICEGGKSNLMIFDNAEDYQSCKNFFPIELHPDLKKSIVILATSRNQEWTSRIGKIQVLFLGVLTDDESLEFILTQLEMEDSPEFREESREFINLIGGLPLALQQAVAYIRQEKEEKEILGQSYQINDYVLEFKSSMKKFLSFSPHPESSMTVYVTWNVTFQKIKSLANGEAAIKILQLLSFLYADKIPFPFLHDIVPEIKLGKFPKALKLIEKYSLIKMNVKDYCLSIHRQLQFVILQSLEESNKTSKLLANLFEKCDVVLDKIKISNESETNDIFLNLHQIFTNPFQRFVNDEFLEVIAKFALVLHKAGRFTESLKVREVSHHLYRQIFGEDHKRTLILLGMVASELSEVGKYDESVAIYEQLVNKLKIHPDFGEHHLFTIAAKQDFASVLMKQTKYKESLELFKEILGQRIRIQGDIHPETVNVQTVIAALYSQLGHSSKSSALRQKLVNNQIVILNPETAEVLRHNKVMRLLDEDQFPQASKILKEIHEEKKTTLGENHPETLKALVDLIFVLKKETNNLEEALSQFRKLYEIMKNKLGEDHPDTINVKLQIVATLFEMKELDDSLLMLQEIYNQLPKIHGDLQERILYGQFEMAEEYLEQGQDVKALELLQDVEREQTEILGPRHADTIETRNLKLEVSAMLKNSTEK